MEINEGTGQRYDKRNKYEKMRKYVSEMFTAAILPKLGSSLHVRPNLVIL